MQTVPLSHFLMAVGGARPPETLEERMRAMQVICRLAIRHRNVTNGGSAGGNAFGNLDQIGRRDFNLTKYQVTICKARAQEELDALRRGKAA